MFILYTKTGCPFCRRVLEKLMELEVSFEEHNIAKHNNLHELLEKGGKQQVPFLVDEEKGVSMYESENIIEYLEKKYANKKINVAINNITLEHHL